MAAPRIALAGQTLPAYARTAGRAVHIKIHPQPRNLAESREVLRVLQQYGEVVMYKHLKHEPTLHAANTALAIFQNAHSAEEIINASPLCFELGGAEPSSSPQEYGSLNEPHPSAETDPTPPARETSEDEQQWLTSLAKDQQRIQQPDVAEASTFTGLSNTHQDSSIPFAQATTIPTTLPRPPQPFTPNPTPSTTITPTTLPFPPSPSPSSHLPPQNHTNPHSTTLTITRSVLNHQAYIQRQHYYGPFRAERKSVMAEDLEARVPVRAMMDCQWGKGEMPLRVRLRRREEELWERERGGRRGLMGVWEEGERERERRDEQEEGGEEGEGEGEGGEGVKILRVRGKVRKEWEEGERARREGMERKGKKHGEVGRG